MKTEPRTNRKTGKTEYKCRYSWKDSNGKLKDSDTGWFPTEKQAFENAMMLRTLKETEAREGKDSKSRMLMSTVFSSFLDELKVRAERETTENTTSDVSIYQKAKTVKEFYFPASVRNTKIIEINTNTFRKWLDYLNTVRVPAKRRLNKKEREKVESGELKIETKELSGRSVRNYKYILILFNRFLGEKGYYLDREVETKVDVMLSRAKIKSMQVGRKERYCPTIADVRKILNYYSTNAIEDFEMFYWYNLFMVLFVSGLRSEEVIGLRWKHVHFDAERPYIDICNAISERELKKNVDKRMENNIYHLKNNNSEREIPMLDYYYNDFESYRYAFKEYFSPANMGDCYVFPNINAKEKTLEEKLHDYQKQKNILRELKKVLRDEDVDLPDSITVQMLRHACATWLVTDQEHGGMGYEESRARDYFGHTSDDMLRNVYAKLDKRQRANRTSETFSELTKKHARARVSKEVKESNEINEKVRNPKANKEDTFNSTYNRLSNEIDKLYHKDDNKKPEKRKIYEYPYLLKDSQIINTIQQKHLMNGEDLSERIKFVLKKTSMDDIWMADLMKAFAEERGETIEETTDE